MADNIDIWDYLTRPPGTSQPILKAAMNEAGFTVIFTDGIPWDTVSEHIPGDHAHKDPNCRWCQTLIKALTITGATQR